MKFYSNCYIKDDGMVKCKLCATKYNIQKATGTTRNMWNHYKKNYLDQTANNISELKKDEFNEKLIQWIVDEMHQYTISEEKGFNDIIKYLSPLGYSIIAGTVKTKIDEVFDDKKTKLILNSEKLIQSHHLP